MAVDWSQQNVTQIYEYINRRWVEEFGHYPDDDEPMIIVMVVAIIAEYNDKGYLRALPDPANKGTLKIPDQIAQAKMAKVRQSG